MEGRRVAIGGNCRPVLNPVCSSSRVNVELRGPLVRVQNGLCVFLSLFLLQYDAEFRDGWVYQLVLRMSPINSTRLLFIFV